MPGNDDNCKNWKVKYYGMILIRGRASLENAVPSAVSALERSRANPKKCT